MSDDETIGDELRDALRKIIRDELTIELSHSSGGIHTPEQITVRIKLGQETISEDRCWPK